MVVMVSSPFPFIRSVPRVRRGALRYEPRWLGSEDETRMILDGFAVSTLKWLQFSERHSNRGVSTVSDGLIAQATVFGLAGSQVVALSMTEFGRMESHTVLATVSFAPSEQNAAPAEVRVTRRKAMFATRKLEIASTHQFRLSTEQIKPSVE